MQAFSIKQKKKEKVDHKDCSALPASSGAKKLLMKVERSVFDIAVILKTNIFSLIHFQGGSIDKSWHSSVCTCVFTQICTNMFVCVRVLEGSVLLMLV